MHIVFIASAASIHSIRWVNFFVNKKDQISLISLTKPNYSTKLELDNIKNEVNIYSFENLKNILKTISFLLFGSYSLVHIHYLGWHSLLAIFKSSKSKLILTPWGSDLLKDRTKMKEIWLKNLFRRANYLICDSKRLKHEAIQLGMKAENTLISMFGVDTDFYHSTRKIFSKNNIYYVGSNRNLESIYDVKTFLKAAKSICNIRNDIFFYIAGTGSLKNEYKSFVKKNKIDKNIKFLGLLNKKEMFNFYNNIDIYVSTSLSDGGLAASIAEAMSFERLIIISNNSDNSFWIKDRLNGFLFKSGDYKKLSSLILNSIEQKEKSIEISKTSRDLIVKNYSYQKEMQKVKEIYTKISRE